MGVFPHNLVPFFVWHRFVFFAGQFCVERFYAISLGLNIVKFFSVVFFLLLVSACSPKPSDPLDGPIPECKELLSPERKDYVDLATQRCDQARTINEKMNSVGCGVREAWLRCDRSRRLGSSRSAFD